MRVVRSSEKPDQTVLSSCNETYTVGTTKSLRVFAEYLHLEHIEKDTEWSSTICTKEFMLGSYEFQNVNSTHARLSSRMDGRTRDNLYLFPLKELMTRDGTLWVWARKQELPCHKFAKLEPRKPGRINHLSRRANVSQIESRPCRHFHSHLAAEGTGLPFANISNLVFRRSSILQKVNAQNKWSTLTYNPLGRKSDTLWSQQ